MSKVLVIGFNSRPIAQSAVKAGFKVVCVDYWGDLDLRELSLDLISILDQTPGDELKRKRKSLDQFISSIKLMKERHEDLEFALIGSGFDDFPEFWKKVNELVPVMGNDHGAIERSRNWRSLFRLLENLGIPFPDTKIVKGEAGLLKGASELGYPLVLKPLRGSGGRGKILISKEEQIPIGLKREYMIQKFIDGTDASASFVANGDKFSLLSINEQLIGTSWLNSPGRFTYCGNVVPLSTYKELWGEICELLSSLVPRLMLKGSNGLDFVLKDGVPYVMEINPRFQGSLECIEEAFKVNLVDLHLSSLRGELKDIGPPTCFSCRGILFSQRDLKLKDLRGHNYVRDISVPGILMRRSTPICSIFASGKSRENVILTVRRRAEEVLRFLN